MENLANHKPTIKTTVTIFSVPVIIIAVHFIIWRLIPLSIRFLLPFASVQIIPTADGRYSIGFLFAFILAAPTVLIILSGGPSKIGLIWSKNNLQWATLGIGFQLVVYPIVNLVQGFGRINAAEAMGLVLPEHYIYYALITAWLVDGFREELYYRGFVQCLIGKAVPAPWRLLIPALFFSFVHININGSLADWLIGGLPHLLPGLLFGILVLISDSLFPAMIAHGAGNFIITGLTGIYIFVPKIYITSIIFCILIGVITLLIQMNKIKMIGKTFRSELEDISVKRLLQGLPLIILLFLGYVLVMHFFPKP